MENMTLESTYERLYRPPTWWSKLAGIYSRRTGRPILKWSYSKGYGRRYLWRPLPQSMGKYKRHTWRKYKSYIITLNLKVIYVILIM